MNQIVRNIVIVLAVAAVVAVVAWMRHRPVTQQTAGLPAPEAAAAADAGEAATPANDSPSTPHGEVAAQAEAAQAEAARPATDRRLPRMVDLGADQCQACKALAPIIEELEKELAGKATIQFIDVWKAPQAGESFHIRVIPTQIFYDREGKEVFRHEGFISKKEILAKLEECGL